MTKSKITWVKWENTTPTGRDRLVEYEACHYDGEFDHSPGRETAPYSKSKNFCLIDGCYHYESDFLLRIPSGTRTVMTKEEIAVAILQGAICGGIK